MVFCEAQALKTTAAQPAKKSSRCNVSLACIKGFVISNFLPLGFLVCIIWLVVWPWPGEQVDSWRVRLSLHTFCNVLGSCRLP